MTSPEDRTPNAPADPPREGAWGAAGVGLLLGLFVLAVLATLHALLATLG
jgi:hypothetical protein